MKNLIFLPVFIFLHSFIFPEFLSAQYLFEDPLHPGIKSVTVKKCEYGTSDSSGYSKISESNYDRAGRMISYLAKNSQSANSFDTTHFQYAEKGNIKTVKTFSRENSYTLKTYDKDGHCIREQNFFEGKCESDVNYVYSADGKRQSVYFVDGDKNKTITEKRTYDQLGRLASPARAV